MSADKKAHLDNCRTGRGRKAIESKNFRVEDELWDAAMRTSIERDEYLSEAVRRFLEQYVAANDKRKRKGAK